MEDKNILQNSDLVGMISSFLCVIHCLAMPIVLSVYSASNGHHHHETHDPLDYMFIFLGLIAVLFSTRNHHSTPMVKVLLWASFALFAFGIAFKTAGHAFEYVSYLGSIGLIAAHWLNYRVCAKAH